MRLATLFRERRHDPRHDCQRPARVKIGECWSETVVRNLSSGGAALETAERPAVDSHVLVEIADLGFFLCRVVRHINGGIAVHFESATFPVPDDENGTSG